MQAARSTEFTNFGMMTGMITSTFDEDDPRRHIWSRGELRHLLRDLTEQAPFPATARADPEVARARERITIQLTLTPTEQPIAAGGRVVVLLPQFWGGIVQERDPTTFHLWGSPQTYPGYVSAHICAFAENPETQVGMTLTCGGSVHTATDIALEGAGIAVGETLTVLVGDPRGRPPLTIEYASTYRFSIIVDADGSGQWRRVAPQPSVRLEAGPPERLRVTVPACVEPGAPLRPKIAALDANLNLADTPSDAATQEREREGARVVLAGCAERVLEGCSNPCVAGPWAEGLNVYFGEIHAHGEISDGIGTLEDSYRFARDALSLDFAGMADHFEYGQPCLYYPHRERWPRTVEAAEEFNAPGSFATLLGYEWGGNPHINVYYRGGEGDVFPAGTPGSRTATELWARLREQGLPTVTIPHHPKFLSRPDWSEHDEELQRLVEIYSTWGCSEEGNEACVQAALARGLRLGFIAGTDCHIGRPGQGNRSYEGGGLACVLAPELTREAIFDALVDRRCYGTTGARLLLDFRVNGALMGSELPATPEREIELRLHGEGEIERAEIVKNGAVVHEVEVGASQADLTWDDSDEGAACYYARVSQVDGHRAWSSPIWVG
jgi:hypothetical protein